MVVPGRWNFDLPDSSFLFPGDVLHYHVEARDQVGGDVGVTTLPADLGGFGDFDGPLAYPGAFTVRALPGLRDSAGGQPRVLFWNDAPGRGADDEWIFALANFGVDHDLYETNAASSGVGNGLGGRATADVLAGYDVLLYTSGTLSNNTLANNDYNQDPSNDLGVVSAWFAQGGKKALLTGDDLVRHLSYSGTAALAFRNQYLGVTLHGDNVVPAIHDQTAPRVAADRGQQRALHPRRVDRLRQLPGGPRLRRHRRPWPAPSASRSSCRRRAEARATPLPPPRAARTSRT